MVGDETRQKYPARSEFSPQFSHLKISRIWFKVDVWSVGIMFYQMLFGRSCVALLLWWHSVTFACRYEAFWRWYESREDAAGHLSLHNGITVDTDTHRRTGRHHVARSKRRFDISLESQGITARWMPSFLSCCSTSLEQVSQEAKDFIKRCLARVEQRPDVLSLWCFPHLPSVWRLLHVSTCGFQVLGRLYPQQNAWGCCLFGC